jgi:cellulose synthase operon protein B
MTPGSATLGHLTGVLALMLSSYGASAAPLAVPSAGPSAVVSTPAAVRETKLTFTELGAGPMALHGVQSIGGVNIGTRKDEVVVSAKLHLRLTYSPAMLPELSHLRISLNGEALAALPLTRQDAGREVEREVELDPRYFSDYNQIRFDLIGHYTMECEDPQHSSLWATISPLSDLTLTVRPVELRDDLALLPAPFFDVHDNRRLTLPMVLPANASREIVRSAGLAASWFGMLADYRSARFPVHVGDLPDQHALVFATNSSKPTGVVLPDVQSPTVRVIDHPANPLVKLLVFQGRDEAQLRQAIEGVVLGNEILTGNSATITHVDYQPRHPYDAPRWVSTDHAVKLGDLVDSPEQLQASGIAPGPIRVNLRLPPDLFTWNRAGVPVDLHYRYTAPIKKDNSLLSVTINDQLLRSYRLPPETESGSDDRFLVPLLQSNAPRQSQGLVIPAFQLASNNQMQFQFAMEFHREGLCKEIFVDNTREAIDPDSTVDISSFPHYTAMPNLSLFANAGYPFTRYADLAQTAIVLSDLHDHAGLEQLFFVLGRFGRQTGAAAMSYQLLDSHQAQQARNLDLLLLTDSPSGDLLKSWGKDLSLVLQATDRNYHRLPPAPNSTLDRTRSSVSVHAQGSLGAYMSFESPVSSGRTVVALVGTDDEAADSLLGVLEDEGKIPAIRGELAIVRSGAVQSYQGTHLYYVGSLSWWQWLWFHVSGHPVLLTLVSLAAAIVVALWIYGWLQRLVARRLDTRAGQ